MPEPEIVFEDPPARIRPTKWLRVMAEVRNNPGRSARVAIFDNLDEAQKLTASLRHLASKLGGEWEIVGRARIEGDAGVWVKYVAPLGPATEVPVEAQPSTTEQAIIVQRGGFLPGSRQYPLAQGEAIRNALPAVAEPDENLIEGDPFSTDLGDHPPDDLPWDNLPTGHATSTHG
jgi:hypothetical protein